MIVIDSSILVGVIKLEEDTEKLLDLLAVEECAIGAPTCFEPGPLCVRDDDGRRPGSTISAGSHPMLPSRRRG
jgi:hypothetical protein